MTHFKQIKWNSTFNLIALLIIGLLLLIFPIESLNIACYFIASMLLLAGVTYIFRIIKKKTFETNEDLITVVLSVVAIVISITIYVDPTWIIRVINYIIGLFLIINSVLNILSLLKFKRDRLTSWYVYLVITILVLIFGIVILIDPKFLAKIIIRFEGATLVVNVILTMILTHKVNKLLELENPKKVVKEIEEKRD